MRDQIPLFTAILERIIRDNIKETNYLKAEINRLKTLLQEERDLNEKD